MAMRQEPIVFNFKPGGKRADAPALEALSQIILLINPETVTIPWKKIITRVRTKSRIVSLYWGQEPLTLTYKGQTGNLFPIEGFEKFRDRELSVKSTNIAEYKIELSKVQRDIKSLYNEPFGDEETLNANLQNKLTEEVAIKKAIAQLSSELGDLTNRFIDGKSHTEIIKLSPKYQKFDELRQLYEKSQTIPELMYVKYRDWLFEGYFENFNFTDDVKSSWNWTYNLTFTILNWDEQFPIASISSVASPAKEVIFVPDTPLSLNKKEQEFSLSGLSTLNIPTFG